MRIRVILAGVLGLLGVAGLIAAALLVSSSDETSGTRSELRQTAAPTTPVEASPEPAPTGDPVAGAAVFVATGCGNCHTLSAAGATGTIGPNLDTRTPRYVTYRDQVRSGGGGMPAYEGTLTDEEIEDVVAFVLVSARP